MKKIFSLILLFAAICVQPIMAIIPESYLRYYLEDENKFWRVRTCTSQDNQEEQLRQDKEGKIVGKNEMILVIKMANPNNGKIYAPHNEIKAFKDQIKAVFVWFDAGLQRSHAVKVDSSAFKDYTALESFYSYIDTLSYEQGAFEGCSHLERIETGTGVPYCRRLGARAFKDCRALKSIDFSRNDYLMVEWEVFSGCTALDTVAFPPLIIVRNTMHDFFNGCQSLRSPGIPDVVESLSSLGHNNPVENMYAGCSSLEELKVPQGLKYVNKGFIKGCTSLKKLTIPNTVEHYDSALLYDCKALDSIYFAAKTIQAHTFDSCANLRYLEIPRQNVDTVEDFAFSGLKNVHSLELYGVSYITGAAFAGSEGIDTINGSGYLWGGARYKEELIYVTKAQTPSLIQLPAATKSINKYAFYNNTAVDTILLTYGVTNIGDSAFFGCTNAKTIYIPNMETQVGTDAFTGVNDVQWSNLDYPNGLYQFGLKWFIDKRGNFSFDGTSNNLETNPWKPWENCKDSIKNLIWPESLPVVPTWFTEQAPEYSVYPAATTFNGYPNYVGYTINGWNGDVYYTNNGGRRISRLLNPVNASFEGDFNVITTEDSVTFQWRAPGDDNENLYKYAIYYGYYDEYGGEWYWSMLDASEGSADYYSSLFGKEPLIRSVTDSLWNGGDTHDIFEPKAQEDEAYDAPLRQIKENQDYTPNIYEFSVSATKTRYKVCAYQGSIKVAEWLTDSMKPTNTYYRVEFVDPRAEDVSHRTLDIQYVKYGHAAVPPADPVHNKYDFAGWDKDITYITENIRTSARYYESDKKPVVVEVTKNESQLSKGVIVLNFKGYWNLGKSYNGNWYGEWQVLENDSVILSDYSTITRYDQEATYQTQVTAAQIGGGEHTLKWRVRSVSNTYSGKAESIWVYGEDIQFIFPDEQAVEDIHVESAQPIKVLHNGQILIIRGEKTYTLTGQEVK